MKSKCEQEDEVCCRKDTFFEKPFDGSTDQQNDDNMELVHITKKNIEVPVYTNIVDIMPNTELVKYKEMRLSK